MAKAPLAECEIKPLDNHPLTVVNGPDTAATALEGDARIGRQRRRAGEPEHTSGDRGLP